MADLSTLQTPLQDPISSLYKDKVTPTPEPSPSAEPSVGLNEEAKSKLGIKGPQFQPIPMRDPVKETAKYEEFIKPYTDREEETVRKLSEFEGLKAKDEAETQLIEQAGVSKAYDKFAEEMQMKEERQRLKDIQEKMSKPFIPTQENANDLFQLFATINVLGAAFGLGGKRNAQLALSSMNGMLEGHRLGREDVYKREKDIFEENLKVLKNSYEALLKEMEEAAELAKVNLDAGTQKAKYAALTHHATFVVDNIDKYGLIPTLESYRRKTDSATKIYDDVLKHNFDAQLKNYELMNKFVKQQNSKIDQAIINELNYYPEATVQDLGFIPQKSQQNIIESFRSAKNIEYIADYVAHNPDAVSALAGAAAKLNFNAINSLDDYELQMAKIPMSEKALILNKLLTSQAYTDLGATGFRANQYLERVFRGFYNQSVTNSTLLSILKERQREANQVLEEYHLGIENNSNIQSYKLFNRDARKYLVDFGPKLVASKADLEATHKANPKKSMDQIKKELRDAGFTIEGEE